MARRLVVGILLSFLICGGLSRAVTGESNTPQTAGTAGAGDLPLVVWQPSESYQGQAQFDARLDKPVRFWRAGVPLREVFADLTRQTGVGFDFLAPEADEPRLCVTLYLNPQQPCSLREVMAQLSWVTGCKFAYSEPGSRAKAYHLLWSSVGQGAAEKLAAEAAVRQDQFRAERQAQQEAQRATTAAALQEARTGLALSQEEAIARYRGVNDALLLNLLDPSRRAALGLLADLPEGDLLATPAERPRAGRGQMVLRDWSAWSPDQQTSLKQALGLEQKWPEEGQVFIMMGAGRGGTLMAVVATEGGTEVLGRLSGLLASGSLRRGQDADLRRYLGEPEPSDRTATAQDQQQAPGRQPGGGRGQQRAQQREQWVQQREQAMAEARALSPEREALLASLTLPAGSGDSLWKLQESVAKATGLDVISDCFRTTRGGFAPPGRGPDSAGPANALDALSAACFGQPPGFGRGSPGFPGGMGGDEDLGQQWGDAGDFLRFRSQRPDIWRAALLPADVQSQLDTWLAPFVPRETGAPSAPGSSGRRTGSSASRGQASAGRSRQGAVPATQQPQTAARRRPDSSPLAGDLEKIGWLASRLNELQIRLGGAIPYEDPSDPAGARLQALRRATLGQIGFRLPLFRLVGSFTPEQWARLRADGLRWGYDLTPEQQSFDLSRMVGGAVPENRMQDLVIRLGQSEERTIELPDSTQLTIPAAPAINFTLDGTLVDQIALTSAGGRGGGPGQGFGGRGGRGSGPGGRGGRGG